MVDVHHIVTWLKLVELLEAQCHLATAGAVALKVELMEAVEYLMVCEKSYLQCIVCEALVQRVIYTGEADVIAPVLEDAAYAVYLLLAIAADEKFVATGQILAETLCQQVEILVEKGLQGDVESQ